MENLTSIDRTRQTLLQDQHKNEWRSLTVTYIYGATGTGKTRYVMDKYGYSEVYRVTDYKHPFDSYEGQDVIVFDEFSGSLSVPIFDMNNYLDGYPLTLPCRYANKQACYTKVYIISNIDIMQQYADDKQNRKAVWDAFARRIHKVMVFKGVGIYTEYDMNEYFATKEKPKSKKQPQKTYPSVNSDAPPVKAHNTTNIAELLLSARNAEPVDVSNIEL